MSTISIVVFLGVAYYFAKPMYYKYKHGIRAELRAKGRKQKTIEQAMNREIKQNVLPVITENPAILESFPETIALAERYEMQDFAGMSIIGKLILPVVRAMSGYMVPQNEQQANVQKAVQIGTEPSIMNLVQGFLSMRNQLQQSNPSSSTATNKTPKKSNYNTTIENI